MLIFWYRKYTLMIKALGKESISITYVILGKIDKFILISIEPQICTSIWCYATGQVFLIYPSVNCQQVWAWEFKPQL